MDINLLVNITSRAWSLPILASLHAAVPGRQSRLLAATGASRTAFTQSIDHLIRIGLLERNPGHGHPLRPEFRLTATGRQVAVTAHKIMAMTEVNSLKLLRKSWSVPILASLRTPRHFTEISNELAPITDRALSQSLKAMEQSDWVRRSVIQSVYPPRSLYKAVKTGRKISVILTSEISLG